MEFKIFNLNCWGIAFFTKYRIQRMQAIAAVLAKSKYDVVCLQEVWLSSDFELIKNEVSGVLPYSHYFHSGVTGSGVCIFSAHPMQEVFFHKWPLNGYIHNIHHGDWFGGKGVGLCRLKVGDYIVNVYSTHLVAEYNKDNDAYKAHRILQAYNTAQFVHVTSGNADLVILAGDMNMEPHDLGSKVMLNIPGLLDSFKEANDSHVDIATNESLMNSFTPLHLIQNKIPGKRIDYIMYRNGSNTEVELKKYELPLPYKIPGHTYSYSDHEALSATLVLKKSINKLVKSNSELQRVILEECIEIFDQALATLKTHKYVYWFHSFVLLVLLLTLFNIKPPFGLKSISNILKVLTSGLMFYTLIMATVWNMMESNALVAGKLGMILKLKWLKAR